MRFPIFVSLLTYIASVYPTALSRGEIGPRDAACGSYICVNAMLRHGNPFFEIAVKQEPVGWVALGFGHNMHNTHMVIMWKNDDNSTTISQRYATGHTEPQLVPSPPQIAVARHPTSIIQEKLAKTHTIAKLNPDATTFSFELLPGQHGEVYNTSRYIWAYSKIHPEDPSPSASLLPGHYVAGLLSLNFSEGADTLWGPDKDVVELGTTSRSHDRLVIAHGVLLVTGFMLLLPSGVLVARFARAFTPRWFVVHDVLNYVVALPVILIGWTLGPVVVLDAQAYHFMDRHQIGGMIILLMYISQLYLGKYIHRRKALGLSTVAHPPSNILHVCFGLSLLILAYFQIQSGLHEWYAHTSGSADTLNFWSAFIRNWALVLLVLYTSGTVFLRLQFTQERKSLYASLKNESESHLIGEES